MMVFPTGAVPLKDESRKRNMTDERLPTSLRR
jgi:hypothetical protein